MVPFENRLRAPGGISYEDYVFNDTIHTVTYHNQLQPTFHLNLSQCTSSILTHLNFKLKGLNTSYPSHFRQKENLNLIVK